jgi:hypothetical protein
VAAADVPGLPELVLPVLSLLAPSEQRALTTALGRLVAAAGEGYGVSAVPPAPL